MKEYYLMAINKGNSITMYNLGTYYEEIKNYDKMKKYYLMAIQKGHLEAENKIKSLMTPLERYILYKEHNIEFKDDLSNDTYL